MLKKVNPNIWSILIQPKKKISNHLPHLKIEKAPNEFSQKMGYVFCVLVVFTRTQNLTQTKYPHGKSKIKCPRKVNPKIWSILIQSKNKNSNHLPHPKIERASNECRKKMGYAMLCHRAQNTFLGGIYF